MAARTASSAKRRMDCEPDRSCRSMAASLEPRTRRGLRRPLTLSGASPDNRAVTATTTPVDTIHELAGRLTRAERQQRPIPPLSAMVPGLTVRDAYAIQGAIVRHRLDAGEWLVSSPARASRPPTLSRPRAACERPSR